MRQMRQNKWKTEIKRRMAAFLTVVMTLQMPFAAFAEIEPYQRKAAGNSVTTDMSGDPEAAFSSLKLSIVDSIFVDKKASSSELRLSVDAVLDDSYLMETFENAEMDEQVLSEPDFDDDPTLVAKFSNYDAYLDASDLPAITFESGDIKLVNDVLDLEKLPSGIIKSDEGEEIGSYEMVEVSEGIYKVRGTFKNRVYNRFNITCGVGIDAQLVKTYEEDVKLNIGKGPGDHDLTVTIPENVGKEPGDDHYKIDKTAEVGEDNTIVYTITAAIASPGELEEIVEYYENVGSDSSLRSENIGSDSSLQSENAVRRVRKKHTKKHRKYRVSSGSDASGSDLEYDEDEDEDEDEYFDVYEKNTVKDVFKSAISTRSSLPEEGATLAGRQILDAIPKGLTLQKVEFSTDGHEWNLLPLKEGAGDGYTYDGTTLNYTLPDDYANKAASIRITTKLSDELYQEHMRLGYQQDFTFSNQARLKGDDETTLAVSPSVRETIILKQPFDKDGGTISTDDMKHIDWTLNVNSDPAGFERLYVVDHIADIENSHNYIATGSIVIRNGNSGGAAPVSKAIQEIIIDGNDSNYKYGELTVTAIEKLLENHGVNTESNTEPYVYSYQRSDGKYDAIMLIPVTEYRGKSIAIDYQTKVTAEEIEAGNKTVTLSNTAKILWKWPDGGPGPGGEFGGADITKTSLIDYSLVIKNGSVLAAPNEDQVIWRFDLNQYGARDLDYLNITDVFMDENQKLLNPGAEEGKSLTLFSSDSAVRDISVPYKAPSEVDLDKIDNTAKSFYTIKETKDSEGNSGHTFFLHLKGDDDPGTKDFEKYHFNLQTQVKSAAAVGAGNWAKVNNTAQVSGATGGKELSFYVDANCHVQNTLIRKESLPLQNTGSSADDYYDYTNNTVKWGITINPRNWTISEPVLTDELPEGLRFDAANSDCQITAASYDNNTIGAGKIKKQDPSGSWTIEISNDLKVQVTEEERTESKNGDTAGLSHKNIKFEFQKTGGGSESAVIDKAFHVEFTTFVEDEYRATFKCDASDNWLHNVAALTGTVQVSGQSVTINAEDSADNQSRPKPLKKNGHYYIHEPYDAENGKTPTEEELTNNLSKYPEVDRIDWTLYVNRTKTDMSGAVIEDQIKDFMELIPASVRVYKVTLDGQGVEIPESTETLNINAFTGTGENDGSDYEHFRYTIPEANKKDTLKFTFTTILVDDAASGDMVNTVTVTNGEHKDSVSSDKAENAANFKLSDYATAKRLYFARVFKTSTNGTNRFPLKGAEFEITEMKLKENGISTDVSDYEEAAGTAKKTRVSNSRGKVNFMFLKPDTMYKIVETKAPEHYQTPYFDWMIVPCMIETSAENWPANMDAQPERPSEPSGGTRPCWVQLNTSGKNYQELTFRNDVSDTVSMKETLKFKKTGYNDKPLAGVTFQIKGPRLNPHTEVSDENGIVTFDQLEPLVKDEHYEITELAAESGQAGGAVGYKRGSGKLYGNVYVDGYDANHIPIVISTLTKGTFADNLFTGATEGNPGTLAVVKNEPITSDASFTKKDQNGTALKGVSFEVKRYGNSSADNMEMTLDPKAPDSFDEKDYQGYQPKDADNPYTVQSNKDGVVILEDLLYGDYLLTETVPETAIDNKKAVQVRLRVDTNNQAKLYDTSAKKWQSVSGAAGRNYTLTNQMQYGFIQIQKVLGKPTADGKLELVKKTGGSDVIPLERIKFHIYEDLGKIGTFEPKIDNIYMSLTTNRNGGFTVDYNDGSYTQSSGSTKVLTVGHYFLHEEGITGTGKLSDQYKPDENYYPFEIKKWEDSTRAPEKKDAVIISSSSAEVNGEADAKGYFLNETKRAPIQLTKVDKDNREKLLPNAEFEVFTESDRKYVADIKYSEEAKKYVLDQAKAKSESVGMKDTSKTESDGSGRPYLEQNTDGNYCLLYGDYIIRETKSPDDAQYSADRNLFALRINDDKVTAGQGFVTTLQDGSNIMNKLLTNGFTVQKYVEQRKADGEKPEIVYDSYEPAEGFTFTLKAYKDADGKGGPANGAGFEPVTAVTKTNGTAEFKNIPVGIYSLTETAVPSDYGTADEPSVTLMPPVKVTVAKDRISYTYEEPAQGAGNEIVKEPSSVDGDTPSVTVSSNELIVRNKLKLGSAKGNKVGIWNDADDKTAALNGAEFELKRTDGIGFTGAIKVQSSGDGASAGQFEITGLPFGTYTLTETKAPEGYQIMAPITGIQVTEENQEVVIQSPGTSAGKINDAPLLKTLQFVKRDQNGAPVKAGSGTTVGFNIIARSASAQDSVPLPKNYDVAALNGKNASNENGYIENDTNGIVTIKDLAYGTYTVTEVKKNGAMIDYPDSLPSFEIKVEADGDNKTKVTLTDKTQGAPAQTVSLTKENADQGTYAFTLDSVDTGVFAVKNALKHGYVNVKKVAADNDGNDSVLNQNTLSPKGDKPLKGVKFAVYEDTDGDTTSLSEAEKATPFLTMVTGADGKFVMHNSTEKYLEADSGPDAQSQPVWQEHRLVYGHTYWLHETGLPDGMKDSYMADTGYYQFTVDDESVKDGAVIYIGTNKESGVKPNTGGADNIHAFIAPGGTAEGKEILFPNGPLKRGTVELTKTDPETEEIDQSGTVTKYAQTVKGAEFDLYAYDGSGSDPAGIKVGRLRDDGNGVYTLRPGTTDDGYTVKNGSGQEYVKAYSRNEYQLLGGSYYIKETKAPSGYRLPDDRAENYWYFTLNVDGEKIENSDIESKNGSSATFTNLLWRREIVVEKQVEQFTKDTWREPEASDGTFIFRLIGTPSNATPEINVTKEVQIAGGDAGKAVFENIPSGRYTLTEELTGKLPDGRDMADVYVQTEPIQVVVDENGVSYDGGQTVAGSVPVKNELKRGSIAGKKLTEDGDGEFALSGATFKLTPVDPAGEEGDVRTAVSKSDGTFKFSSLPLGAYELVETVAPQGYEKDETVYTVKIESDGQTVETGMPDAAGAPSEIRFVNQAVSSLTLIKTAEVQEATGLGGTQQPGAGFEFCVSGASYDGKDVTELFADGKLTVTGAERAKVKNDGNAGPGLYVVTGASGRVLIKGLPAGDYQVLEAENEKNGADGIYVRDTESREANVEINHGNGHVSTPVVTVANRLKRSDIQGIKTKSDRITPLAGAVIGLFPGDAAEYTENALYRGLKVTTGEDGVFRFANLPYGEYQIREMQAPGGFILNSAVFKVKVTEDGKTIVRGETAAGEADLLIANNKKSSSGGGGIPTKPDPSNPGTGPGAPTEPAPPEESEGTTEPGAPAEPTEPTEPLPTIPAEPDEDGGTVVIIPPDTPPGSDVIIRDHDRNTVFEGKTGPDGNLHVNLPPGEYELITIDDEGVPLAQMTFTILDDEIPLALMAPDAGDHAIPLAMLAVILLGALAGVIFVLKKRKDLDKEE